MVWLPYLQKKLNTGISVLAGFLSGCSFLMMYVAAFTFRDTLVSFLLIYIFYKLKYSYSIKKNWVLIGFIVFVIFQLRVFSGLLSILIIILCYKEELKSNKILYLFVSLLVFSGGIFVFLKTGLFENFKVFYDKYIVYRTSLSNEGIGAMIFKTPLFPFGIFYRIVYLFVTPIPIFDNNFLSNIIKFGVYLRLFIIPFVFVSFFSKKLRKELSIELLVFLAIFMIIALTTFQIRQMTMFLPFLFLIGIKGYLNSTKNNRIVIITSTLFLQLSAFVLTFFFYLV